MPSTQSLFRFSQLLLLSLQSAAALAQGLDSTPGERYLLILSDLLPGTYDNANQHYFDKRRDLDAADRHARVGTKIERVSAPAFGSHAFLWVTTVQGEDGPASSYRIASLSADGAEDEVVMRHYFRGEGPIDRAELAALRPGDLRRTPGCDYRFKRRAGQFRGRQDAEACRFDWQGEAVYTDNVIELSKDDLWFADHKYRVSDGQRISGVKSGEPYWLERARPFHCYADVPGVGGGRDIPFERYDGIELHDKGGTHWFTTRDTDARRIGIALRSVTWHVLNERNGAFNRDSLVLYAMEELEDGTIKEHGYAFTEPGADRIGYNMKWMLVNCATVPRDQARPEM